MWPIKDKNLIRQDLCRIHKFKVDDKLYVFDIASARYFEIDQIGWDILEGLENHSIEEIRKRLEARYPASEVQRSIKGLERKKRKRSLFTSAKPPLFEHYKIKNLSEERYLKEVTILPSLDCNLSCHYCFHPYNKIGLHMDIPTAEKVVDFILRHSYRKCNIGFNGGEALLNFRIIKYITEGLAGKAKKYKKRFRFSIGTNGTICNKEIAGFLKRFDFGVTLSLDGPEDIHDSMRKYPDGRPSHKEVLFNLENYFYPNLDMKKLGIAAVLSPGHFDRFHEIYDYLVNLQERLGLKKFLIVDTVYRRELFSERDMGRYKEVLKKSSQLFLERCLSGKSSITGLPDFPRYIKEIHRFKYPEKFLPCQGGTIQLAILPNGDLLHCRQIECLPDYSDLIFGNINSVDIKEKKRRLLYDQTCTSSQKCLTCWVRHFCLPACPALNYYATKDFSVPDNLQCEILKTKLECSIWLLDKLIHSGAGQTLLK